MSWRFCWIVAEVNLRYAFVIVKFKLTLLHDFGGINVFAFFAALLKV